MGAGGVVTSAYVSALTGNGNSFTTHTLLSTPLCHVTSVASHEGAPHKLCAPANVTCCVPAGLTSLPPIEAILPQDPDVSDWGAEIVVNASSQVSELW